jgi:hypothetical protein
VRPNPRSESYEEWSVLDVEPYGLADDFFAGVDPDDREYRPGPPGALKRPYRFP